MTRLGRQGATHTGPTHHLLRTRLVSAQDPGAAAQAPLSRALWRRRRAQCKLVDQRTTL